MAQSYVPVRNSDPLMQSERSDRELTGNRSKIIKRRNMSNEDLETLLYGQVTGACVTPEELWSRWALGSTPGPPSAVDP